MIRHKLDIAHPVKRGVKIYKYNPLIMGRVDMKKLTDFDFRFWNFLYARLQKEIRQNEKIPFESYTMSIPLKDIKQGLYGGKYADRWRATLAKSLTRLTCANIHLKDFDLPALENGEIISETTKSIKCKQADFSLLLESFVYKKHIEINFSKCFVYFAWLKRNYTHISEATLNLNSKYTQKLSELIEHYISIYKARDWNEKALYIENHIFNEALGLDDKNSISVNLNLINFKKVILPQLLSIYPNLEVEREKGYLIFRFNHTTKGEPR